MLNGKFVIDSVTHAFDGRPENMKAGRYAELTYESYFQAQWDWLPAGYALERERYFARMTADALASALFVESDTDVAFYHTIPMWGVFGDLSPLSVGAEIRDRYPGRMLLYGGVSPLEGPKAIDDLVRQVEEYDISAVKLYPYDIIDGSLVPFNLGDERVAYPLLEKCVELGLRVVAIHKSIPDITAPVDFFRPGDVDFAARDFPSLHFEIVHGGFAFLEETRFQLPTFPNIFVNLESTSALALKHPRKFARILGELLTFGSHEQVVWGTGTSAFHPAPLLHAFEQFEMPQDLVEGEGFPVITEAMKADMLARNAARIHGLDIEELKVAIEGDELADRRESGDATPWHALQPVS